MPCLTAVSHTAAVSCFMLLARILQNSEIVMNLYIYLMYISSLFIHYTTIYYILDLLYTHSMRSVPTYYFNSDLL